MKNDILIIGDSCLDIFTYCDAVRLAPDFPVPILNIIEQKVNPGMAKNVQRNIEKYLPCDIITNSDWEYIRKNRFVHNKTNHMFMRVDTKNSTEKISIANVDLDYKLIVISDYNKGFITENDIEYICRKNNNVFLDTKKKLGQFCFDAAFIKINDFEFNNSSPQITNLLKEKIIHTVGENGCNYNGVNYPVDFIADVKDTSGAGDSFMSALVIEYIRTKNIVESIKFANKCASEVVKHRGVTTI